MRIGIDGRVTLAAFSLRQHSQNTTRLRAAHEGKVMDAKTYGTAVSNGTWSPGREAQLPEGVSAEPRINLRTCNRHRDCDKAAEKARADGRFSECCHDEDCEDCFGK